VSRPLRLTALVAAILVAAWLPGCGSDSPTGPTPDQAVDTAGVDAAIAASGFDADALFPSWEISLADTATLKVAGGFPAIAFRRPIPRYDKIYNYEVTEFDRTGRPLTVVAGRCKYQKGVLQLVRQLAPDDPTPADSSDRLIDKTMNADWMRMVRVQRADAQSPWTVTAVGPVLLVVDDKRVCATCHADLVLVRLQAGPVDVMLNGNSMAIDSVLQLPAGAIATVTATSSNDAHVVLLHDEAGSHVLRRSAPNVFSGRLTIGGSGLRHFTVEVLSDSSLFDDAVRVSQHGWTFPYRVAP
jgi:hypothetical protein